MIVKKKKRALLWRTALVTTRGYTIRDLSTGERQRLKGVVLKPFKNNDIIPSIVYGEIKEFQEEFEDKDQK